MFVIENVSKYLDSFSIQYRFIFDTLTCSMPSQYVSRNLVETMFLDHLFTIFFCFIIDVHLDHCY